MTILEQTLEANRLMCIYQDTRVVAEKMGVSEAYVMRLLTKYHK